MIYPLPSLCPCCKFPTLNESGCFEICLICWWEDDGQNVNDASAVRGGPNGRYSLTLARQNFADHGDMYDTGRGIQAVEEPSPARRELIAYLRNLRFFPDQADTARLSSLLSIEDGEPDVHT